MFLVLRLPEFKDFVLLRTRRGFLGELLLALGEPPVDATSSQAMVLPLLE